MDWVLWGVVFFSMMAGLSFGLYQRMKRKSRQIIEELQQGHGQDLRFVSGCGIVSGYNRVPGILALLQGRILYRPLTFKRGGEIPLHSVIGLVSEDTQKTAYRRARKYRNAHVLVFRTDRGEEKIFVVQKDLTKAWEESLKNEGIRPEGDVIHSSA